MNRKMICVGLIFFMFSCARVQTLNVNPHTYSEKPNQVVWLQLSGFSADFIPLLKYNRQESSGATWFEGVDCAGKMFSYNLFQLRPEAQKSFLAQMLGSKNIKNSCEDLDRPFVWNEFARNNFNISIIENGFLESDSLDKLRNCNMDLAQSFKMIRLWKMAKKPTEIEANRSLGEKLDLKFFHYQETKEQLMTYTAPGVYYDKACQQDTCYSSLTNNVKSLMAPLLKENSKNLLIIRENNFLKAIKKKDISGAREVLVEMDQLLRWISNTFSKNTLVVVTGAEAINIEYPLEGKEWEEFLKSGKNFTFKNSSLTSSVLALGPSAENFCGVFEESDFARRLHFKQMERKFSWDLLNPFAE